MGGNSRKRRMSLVDWTFAKSLDGARRWLVPFAPFFSATTRFLLAERLLSGAHASACSVTVSLTTTVRFFWAEASKPRRQTVGLRMARRPSTERTSRRQVSRPRTQRKCHRATALQCAYAGSADACILSLKVPNPPVN